jgi:2-polyprenyl-3-methyl-5-hydroxy-6-metoxy-1,4-benzoquinol methylase
MTTLNNCPLCSSQKIVRVLTSKDYFLTLREFNVDTCNSCGISFTNPIPSEAETPTYYHSDNYISHGRKTFSFFYTVYKIVRTFSLQWKTEIVRQAIGEKGSIMDYGCGTGDFLLTCKEKGYQILGVEPSRKAREEASGKLGRVVNSNLDSLGERKFDIITLWHVLEHVPDIKTTIATLKSHLNQKGTLIIAVPNHKSYDANQYKQYWAGYDLPRHLWHFDQEILAKIIENAGLQFEKVIPMKLDSYYVSILSSKYMPGNKLINLLKSFKNGLLSNMSAKITNEYSSLIYIAKAR